jgi:hypothetical protein
MRATLVLVWPEFTRPAYSSIVLGVLPAAWMMVGFSISLGMGWSPIAQHCWSG